MSNKKPIFETPLTSAECKSIHDYGCWFCTKYSSKIPSSECATRKDLEAKYRERNI